MSVLDRLEEIRVNERLKKKDFEAIIGKSSGYIKVLRDKNGIPGSDVLIKVSEHFRNYDLNWLLTGEGKMLKSEQEADEENLTQPNVSEDYVDLRTLRDEIRGDLKNMVEGMTKNFNTISEGVYHTLQDTQKITKFIDKLDLKELKNAGKDLRELVKERK